MNYVAFHLFTVVSCNLLLMVKLDLGMWCKKNRVPVVYIERNPLVSSDEAVSPTEY